jgi:hypothetical protein
LYDKESSLQLPVYKGKIAARYLGIFDEECDHLEPLFSDIKEGKRYVQVWISPSGTGKTHSLLQAGSTNYCLYFIGAYQKFSYITEDGHCIYIVSLIQSLIFQ